MKVNRVKYKYIYTDYKVLNISERQTFEIDIVLFSRKYICLIQVKENAKLDDLIKFTEQSIPNFIKTHSKYNKCTIQSFFAAFSFEKDFIEQAKQKHIGLLKYRGEHFKVINNI